MYKLCLWRAKGGERKTTQRQLEGDRESENASLRTRGARAGARAGENSDASGTGQGEHSQQRRDRVK